MKPSVNGTQKLTNQYRLVIHIDKIRVKPGPRSQKLLRIHKIRNKLIRNLSKSEDIPSKEKSVLLNSEKSGHQDTAPMPNKKSNVDETVDVIIKNEVDKRNDVVEYVNYIKTVPNTCVNGCKLENATFNKRQIIYCTQCKRAYLQKRSQLDKKHRCLICKNVFENSEILTEHIKQHSTCGTCGIECHSKENLENHTKQHIGRPPHFPFKCHLCTEVFRKEEHVRSHLTNKHYIAKNVGKKLESIVNLDPQIQNVITQTLIEVQHPLKFEVHRCIPCNITFRNEEAFQRHARSHKSKEAFSPIKIDQTIQQIHTSLSQPFGQLCPVKFTCRVCSQELTSVVEIDAHTKAHMNSDAQHSINCTMCDQVFTSNDLLNEHIREHLARAHRCPICSKAFINKSTLKIHLKTHSAVEIL